MFPGLRYCQYLPVIKFRVVSKKSVCKKLDSIVILRPLFSKLVDMFFLILSMIGPDLLFNGQILIRTRTNFITDTDKFYYGSCETSFKLRYNNHNQFFKDNRKIKSTKLSKAVWKLKQSGQSPEIRWKIVQHITL